MKPIHWVALAVVLLLVELWADAEDGQSSAVDFAATCSAFSDKEDFGQAALAQGLGEAHCAPSLIEFLSRGRAVLWNPGVEDAVSTKSGS